jgi:hypothetical protein
MDKNMINIDDLFRQRLGGGEETERPGAWMHMRELLDQRMPERPIGGFNWRRMLGVMSGLVLLSVLTVGGYHVVNSTRFNFSSPSNPVNSGRNSERIVKGNHATSGQTASQPGNDNRRNSSTAIASATVARPSSVTLSENSQVANNQSVALKAGSSKVNTAHSVIPGSRETRNAGIEASVASNRTGKRAALQNKLNSSINGKASSNTSNTSGLSSNNSTSASNSQNSNSSGFNSNTSSNISNPGAPANDLLASTEKISGLTAPLRKSSGNQIDPLQNVSAAAADNTATKRPAPVEPILAKDSMNKLNIVRRYSINTVTMTSVLMLDTISVERFAVENLASAGEEATSSNIGLAAAAGISENGLENLVPLSSMKVASKRTNAWWERRRGLEDLIRDTKFNLAHVRFYPGVSIGGNSYIGGSNTISGVQFGLFALLTFGENISLMGELKYIHKFNNGSQISDDYFDVKQVSGSDYQAKVEHFFKFSTLQSLEMPIALRYALNRAHIMAGLNTSYNFEVNAEGITRMPNENDYEKTSSPSMDNKPTITYDDLKARFSLGYLLGVGYELTPALQLDLRMTKNFWDYGNGLGQLKVAQQLYRAPSIQFSLFYRFSQKNQIPAAQ